MDVLISGASIAGPALAYWLGRFGFHPTVVEIAPALRTGGNAVDFRGPLHLGLLRRMGVLEALEQVQTGGTAMRFEDAAGHRLMELPREFAGGDIEVLRGDLSRVLAEAAGNSAEYLFGDTVTAMTETPAGVEVTFRSGREHRFDLVIGADGLHSGVRGLIFGPESAHTVWLGGYIAVAPVPHREDLHGSMLGFTGVNRLVGVYSARHMADARAFFLFRPPAALSYDRRDQAQLKHILRTIFADLGGDVRRLLDDVDRSGPCYFDSITQLRLDTWSRGRVTLVGDAGYCPGPAVGGSTSLAVVGAYILAGELALAGGDHAIAYPAYERAISSYVQRSRAFAKTMAKRLVPANRAQAWAMTSGVQLLTRIPPPVLRTLTRFGGGLGLHESVEPKDYPTLVEPASPDSHSRTFELKRD